MLYAACCMLMCIAVNCLVCTVYCILHCVTVLHHNTYSLARKLVRSVNICCTVELDTMSIFSLSSAVVVVTESDSDV